ncbi:MAG: SIS domain-containing protein [Bacillota bacterium]|jgi:D-sedoheptulose 7-phosphate isomerase|nr:SIS domain-containing protein [Bacillota bacterium]
MNTHLRTLLTRYPDLESCLRDVNEAFEIWRDSFASGHKTLICGNGGSAADSEHIVGELMKGFISRRPVGEDFLLKAEALYGDHGRYLANHLQGALPAISLSSQLGLISAFGNDVSFDMVYAQQVYGYGKPGDVLVAISTSGNSPNVLHAVQVAKLRGLGVIGFTGKHGGEMAKLCDVSIQVPDDETYRIQERHLAIYHTLCIMLEEEFFAHEGSCGN